MQHIAVVDAAAVTFALAHCSAEVRRMVAALTPKVEQCREQLTAQHVGNALYGLQLGLRRRRYRRRERRSAIALAYANSSHPRSNFGDMVHTGLRFSTRRPAP